MFRNEQVDDFDKTPVQLIWLWLYATSQIQNPKCGNFFGIA